VELASVIFLTPSRMSNPDLRSAAGTLQPPG
jgi:hypothetical protein